MMKMRLKNRHQRHITTNKRFATGKRIGMIDRTTHGEGHTPRQAVSHAGQNNDRTRITSNTFSSRKFMYTLGPIHTKRMRKRLYDNIDENFLFPGWPHSSQDKIPCVFPEFSLC